MLQHSYSRPSAPSRLLHLVGLVGVVLLVGAGCGRDRQQTSVVVPPPSPEAGDSTDNLPGPGTDYNEVSSRDGRFRAYNILTDDGSELMIVEDGSSTADGTHSFSGATPLKFGMDRDRPALLYAFSSPSQAPALLLLDPGRPGDEPRWLTNQGLARAPLSADYVSIPAEATSVGWTDNTIISYSVGRTSVAIDLRTGGVSADNGSVR